MLAVVSHQIYSLNPWILSCKARDYLPTFVGTMIVHKNNFILGAEQREGRYQAVIKFHKRGLTIEDGTNNRNTSIGFGFETHGPKISCPWNLSTAPPWHWRRASGRARSHPTRPLRCRRTVPVCAEEWKARTLRLLCVVLIPEV